MNLPNSSKIFKGMCLPLISLFIVITVFPLNSQQNEYRACVVRDGRVYLHDPGTVREYDVPGYTHRAVLRENVVYYLRSESINSPVLYAGYRDIAGNNGVDRKLPVEFENIQVAGFDAGLSSVYFLCSDAKHGGDAGRTLYSYNLKSFEISKQEHVFDFDIHNNMLLVIQKKDDTYFLRNNSDELPLSLHSSPRFEDSIAGGISVISGGGEREIVDVARMKSVYLYSENRRYVLPEEYNLEIRAVDEGTTGQVMIFYKISIDGSMKGRTKTALAQLPLLYQDKLEQSSYHIITLERWELNKARKQYLRVNNIHQPESVKIYMPENRIMKLNVIFNGKKYIMRESFAEE